MTALAGYEAFIAPVLAGDSATVELAGADGAIFSTPGFAALQGVGGTALMLGLLLFGIAVVRSRVFPRWTGVLMVVAPVLLLAPVLETLMLTGLLIELPRGLAMAAMGWMLFARRDDEHGATAGAAKPQFGVVAAR